MLERHELLQVDGEHTEEDGVAKGSQHRGQVEGMDGQPGVDKEIHHHRIAHHCRNTQGEKVSVLQLEHLAPKQAEEAAGDGTRPLHEVQCVGGNRPEMEHAAGKGSLQHLGRTAHKLNEGEEDEQRDEPLILPSPGSNVGVTDV